MSNIDLTYLFSQRYPGLRRNIKSSIYEILPAEDLRKMPADMNSIAWNIWHMARAEDVGINRLLTEGQQVFDQGKWMESMNINIRHYGTGMTKEEVVQLSKNIDLAALRAYHEAVGEQTMAVFDQLANLSLNENLEEEYLHQVMIEEGVLHPNALWVKDFYLHQPKAWFLVHLGLTHSFEHLGQIMIIRKLLGHKGTR